jgi:glyoxylase-like metal-dependent hydrolase (beta-lactamase superfamily II)
MAPSLDLGLVHIDLVPDRYGDVDGNSVFSPATQDEWGAGFTPNAQGKIPVTSHALLIREAGQLSLVDTGWGEAVGWLDPQNPTNAHMVLANLAKLGVQPKEIGRVILTHSHSDHICGNTLRRDGRWVPAFPLAEYVLQKAELEAIQGEEQLWRMAFEPLAARGQLRAISGRLDLSEAVTCWPTPGHTAGHQAVLLRGSERQALYLGDLAILALNLEHPEWGPEWAWSRDADRESRHEVAEWALATGGILLLGHDPERPMLTLARAAAGYRALPFSA